MPQCVCRPACAVPEQAAHPALAGSRDLQAFLEANEEEWGLEMSRAGHDGASSMHSAMGGGGGGNAAQKAVASTLQRLKNLGHQTQTLVSGKHADEEEDPEYLKASLQRRCPHHVHGLRASCSRTTRSVVSLPEAPAVPARCLAVAERQVPLMQDTAVFDLLIQPASLIQRELGCIPTGPRILAVLHRWLHPGFFLSVSPSRSHQHLARSMWRRCGSTCSSWRATWRRRTARRSA